MPLMIYTSTYRYSGPDRLDITVKSGDEAFAPTWPMVMDHKAEKITDQQYTELYYAKMRESYRQRRSRWEALLKLERVVLVCFCAPDKFCHRRLLADILVKLGAVYKGEI